MTPAPWADDLTWGVPHGARYVREELAGTVALFHPLSGKTHLLDPTAFALIEELMHHPATLAGLLARLELPPAEHGPRLRRLLWELDQVGLIAPVTPGPAPGPPGYPPGPPDQSTTAPAPR